MKAADITDEAFLYAVSTCSGPYPAVYWQVAEHLGYPEKVVLAKARRVQKRGLITGCTCGCRGGWEIVEPPETPEPPVDPELIRGMLKP